MAHYEQGLQVVLIVDEAHLVRSSGTFEELRLILNCQMNDRFMINLILFGQLEIREKLAKVPALQQRISIRHTLKPLDARETGEMVLHRLRVAGYSGEQHLFTPDAIHELHKCTGGVPRLICQYADTALLLGMAQKAKLIDGFLMHDVAGELVGEEVAA
jgi:general secretion pathway protein A